MNICMVAYTFYEQDNRVMRYAETLAARGDDVDVLALSLPGQLRYEMIHGVCVFRIQTRTVGERSQLKYLWRVLLFLINSGIRLSLRHLRHRYDVIHVHSIPDFEVFAALLPKLLGAKVVLDIHDLVPEFYASKFGMSRNSLPFRGLLLLERMSSRFANHVIIANDLWRERLIKRSVPANRCSVFLNYPDPQIFSVHKRERCSEAFILVYPGTLQRHQGLDLVIRALAEPPARQPRVDLHIYGNGTELPALKDLAEKLGVADRVRFQDFMPMREVADRMALADAGVVAKRADTFGNEAFSTKILEFMALGVPVIAARTDVDRFYFDDQTIEFFPSGDVLALANAIARIRDDSARRRQLVEHGLACARRYSWAEHSKRYLALVDGLAFKNAGLQAVRE